MKKIILLTLSLIVASACDNSSTGKRLVTNSTGSVNNLSVVVDNEYWDGSVGESIRNILAAPVYGLPQEEPLFNMSQMPPHVFSGFATKNRTVLKIEKGEADIKFLKNTFAKPQTLVLVTGQNSTEIIAQLEANADRIVSSFKAIEIKEIHKRIKISPHTNNNIEKTLGLTIDFPTIYRVATEDDDFFWIRKDTKNGSMNLMLYTIPMDAISTNEENAVNDIIKIRDSIGQKYIPGPIDGSYMITEAAYTPFIGKTIIDNKPALETKSTWEVKNAFMAGPFVNYIIEDKVNNRLVVAEGFAYAPASEKRDKMFELEAIIKSISIK